MFVNPTELSASQKRNRKKSIKKNIKQTQINLTKIYKNLQQNIIPFSLKPKIIQTQLELPREIQQLPQKQPQSDRIHQNIPKQNQAMYENQQANHDLQNDKNYRNIQQPNNSKDNFHNFSQPIKFQKYTGFIQNNSLARNAQSLSNAQKEGNIPQNQSTASSIQLQIHLTIAKKKYTLKIMDHKQNDNLAQIVQSFLIQNQISNPSKKNHMKVRNSIIQMVQQKLLEKSKQNRVINNQATNQSRNNQMSKQSRKQTQSENLHRPKFQKPIQKQKILSPHQLQQDHQQMEGCSPSFKQSQYLPKHSNIQANGFSPEPKHKNNRYQKLISNYYNQNLIGSNQIKKNQEHQQIQNREKINPISPGQNYKRQLNKQTNKNESFFQQFAHISIKNDQINKMNKEKGKKNQNVSIENRRVQYQNSLNNQSNEQEFNPKSVYQKWKLKQKEKSIPKNKSKDLNHNNSFDNALKQRKNYPQNNTQNSSKKNLSNKKSTKPESHSKTPSKTQKQKAWNNKISKNLINFQSNHQTLKSNQNHNELNKKNFKKGIQRQKQQQRPKSPTPRHANIQLFNKKQITPKSKSKYNRQNTKSPALSNHKKQQSNSFYNKDIPAYSSKKTNNNFHTSPIQKPQFSKYHKTQGPDGKQKHQKPYKNYLSNYQNQQDQTPSQQSLIHEMSPDHFYKQGLLFQAKKNLQIQQKFNQIYPFTTRRYQQTFTSDNRYKSRNSKNKSHYSKNSREKYFSSSFIHNPKNNHQNLQNNSSYSNIRHQIPTQQQKQALHQRLYKQTKLKNHKVIQNSISSKSIFTITRNPRSQDQITLMKQNLKNIKGLSKQKQEVLIQKNIQIKQKVRQNDKIIDQQLNQMIKEGKVQPIYQIVKVQKSPFRKTKVF